MDIRGRAKRCFEQVTNAATVFDTAPQAGCCRCSLSQPRQRPAGKETPDPHVRLEGRPWRCWARPSLRIRVAYSRLRVL